MWTLIIAYDGQDRWSTTVYPSDYAAILARNHICRTTKKEVKWTAIVTPRSKVQRY